MEASRLAKYLNALGVVQYRRRSLTVVNAAATDEASQLSRPEAVSLEIGTSNTPVPGTVKTSPKITEIFEKPAAADLVQELEQVKDDLVNDSYSANGSTISANSKPAFGFDLLVWRSANILVLEFSVVESEDIDLKHRLANNILKALWAREFNGVEVHQHSWPMQGVAADIVSATEWLNSLVAGHLHHEGAVSDQKSTPIWIMGELGLKMLFPEYADSSEKLSDLIGTRTRHEKLGVDLLISPGLKTISESVVAKAQTWQLLKPVR